VIPVLSGLGVPVMTTPLGAMRIALAVYLALALPTMLFAADPAIATYFPPAISTHVPDQVRPLTTAESL
jgi:hypothetical protein